MWPKSRLSHCGGSHQFYGLWRLCWQKVSFSSRGVKGSLGNSSDQNHQPSRAKVNNYQFQVLLVPPTHPTDACRNKKYFCVYSIKGRATCAGLSSPSGLFIPYRPFPQHSLGTSNLVHHPEDRSIHRTFSPLSLQFLIMKMYNCSLPLKTSFLFTRLSTIFPQSSSFTNS